ncbi:MAG: hypothetical protein ACK4TA_06365 [Saprospiraceae bacterium]
MNKTQEFIHIIKLGVQLIQDERAYPQSTIIHKIKQLSLPVSAPSLSNVMNNQHVGQQALLNLSTGIQTIIENELGYYYDDKQKIFIPLPAEQRPPSPVMPKEKAKELPPIFHLEGRLPIQEKVKFINKAQKNIIEVGVRLNTFSEYFKSRNKHEFQIHIEQLLQKGINMQVYLLDPASPESKIYFQDRAKAQPDERHALEETERAVERLLKVKAVFEKNQYPGQFEVFAYQHIPYNHFVIIDGDTDTGQMLVSHYIYGIERAQCPVMEFSKATSSSLYDRYWQSLQALIQGTKQLV